MTNTRTVQVTCPSCHAQGEFTVYKSINTKESPALKEKVRDGSLFQFSCPPAARRRRWTTRSSTISRRTTT